MNNLPLELVDHILYFTTNRINVLNKVNKYFDKKIFEIKLGNSINFDNFKELSKLTELDLKSNYRFGFGNKFSVSITNNILAELDNLISLDLSYNRTITDISTLTNLEKLILEGNYIITADHLVGLNKLKHIDGGKIDKMKLIPKGFCLDYYDQDDKDYYINNKKEIDRLCSLTGYVSGGYDEDDEFRYSYYHDEEYDYYKYIYYYCEDEDQGYDEDDYCEDKDQGYDEDDY